MTTLPGNNANDAVEVTVTVTFKRTPQHAALLIAFDELMHYFPRRDGLAGCSAASIQLYPELLTVLSEIHIERIRAAVLHPEPPLDMEHLMEVLTTMTDAIELQDTMFVDHNERP